MYTVSWQVPEQILYLSLEGEPQIQELKDLNRQVLEMLEPFQKKVNIVMNVIKLKPGYRTSDHLRDTQRYMDLPQIDHVFVVADNKLSRLTMLLAFSLSRAHFMLFDDLQKTMDYVNRRGLGAAANG